MFLQSPVGAQPYPGPGLSPVCGKGGLINTLKMGEVTASSEPFCQTATCQQVSAT